MRTARCLSCKEEAPIKDFMNHIKNGEIHRCTKCKALIKPDVVFFGEGLPSKFF
jgi:NAD-dependent SIR2 family protein deacetylase